MITLLLKPQVLQNPPLLVDLVTQSELNILTRKLKHANGMAQIKQVIFGYDDEQRGKDNKQSRKRKKSDQQSNSDYAFVLSIVL